MLPAKPGISTSGSPSFLLLDQGTIGAIPGADAAIVAAIGEGDLIFIIAPHKPANYDLGL
jgi:hypothetical protein